MNYFIETLIGVFTIDKGKIKILLMRKNDNPYKGYWILPCASLKKDTLEENIDGIIDEIGLPNLFIQQTKTYSNLELNYDKKTVGVSYIGLIDSITYTLKKEQREGIELEWFDVNSIPKIAYEHNVIIEELYNYFKKQIVNSNILRILFPSDFTLPELQKIYEQVLNTKLDRRNFRKKLMNLGYIVDTGDINEGYTGRPAKLYRFKEEIEEKNLF